MTDHRDDLRSALGSIARARAARDSSSRAELDLDLWESLEGLGFTALGVDEDAGGSGGDLGDAAVALEALPTGRVPLAEAAFVAGPVFSVDLPWPAGPTTSGAGALEGDDLVTGSISAVPWARDCRHVVVLDPDRQRVVIVELSSPEVDVAHGTNIAGEARDRVVLRAAPVVCARPVDVEQIHQWRLREATARSIASAGAASAILQLTVKHTAEREQFGRPVNSFQAVSHRLAQMAGQVALVHAAADAAVHALLQQSPATTLMVAAAKAESAELARQISLAAHQAHGAIGFTEEHALGSLTRRLWAWRDEHGNEDHWRAILGRAAAGADPWPLVAPTHLV